MYIVSNKDTLNDEECQEIYFKKNGAALREDAAPRVRTTIVLTIRYRYLEVLTGSHLHHSGIKSKKMLRFKFVTHSHFPVVVTL